MQLVLFADQQPVVLLTCFFFSCPLKEVAGSQMLGVHVIDEKKDLTMQTMISPAQLKLELRTKLVR
jgi:hypothetical protein